MIGNKKISIFIFATGICLGASVFAQPPLVGSIRIPGTQTDRSGLSGTLETGTPVNALGGFSAIDYCGAMDRYFVLSDRGAGDGAASFPCRFHEIEFAPGDGKTTGSFSLISTTLLRTRDGRPFTGSLEPMRTWNGSGHSPSLDPEGIRYDSGDRLLVSDEYGPSIDWFDRSGILQESLRLPEYFRLTEKLTPPMTRGTYPNRGLEGISLTPSRDWLVAAMQGPLVQDGRIENNKCLGIATRWLVCSLKNGETKEWLYMLDNESTGISEVLAIDDRRFLALERDSKSGSKAKIKRVYLVDSSSASDVSTLATVRDGLPTGTQPLAKRLLIDLLRPEYGLAGEAAPEKPEGMAWGPATTDGARLLVLCVDNDFVPEQDSILLSFQIDSSHWER